MTPDEVKAAKEVEEQRRRRYAHEYREASDLATMSEKRRKDLREIILGIVEQHGDTDEVGNTWLPAIDHMIKRELRRSTSFDPEEAERWLRDNGWWDEAKETIPEVVVPEHDVITEDGLAAFLFRKREDDAVPDELPDEVYNVKDTYALKVTKEDQHDY